MLFFGNILFGETNDLKNREMHIKYGEYLMRQKMQEPVADSKKPDANGGRKKVVSKSGRQKWSANLRNVLEQIRSNPHITRKELSEALKINQSAIQKHIERLKKEKVIVRIGSDKTGYWKMTDKESKDD
jgi:predicted HTH transcriptional regulator